MITDKYCENRNFWRLFSRTKIIFFSASGKSQSKDILSKFLEQILSSWSQAGPEAKKQLLASTNSLLVALAHTGIIKSDQTRNCILLFDRGAFTEWSYLERRRRQPGKSASNHLLPQWRFPSVFSSWVWPEGLSLAQLAAGARALKGYWCFHVLFVIAQP